MVGREVVDEVVDGVGGSGVCVCVEDSYPSMDIAAVPTDGG